MDTPEPSDTPTPEPEDLEPPPPPVATAIAAAAEQAGVDPSEVRILSYSERDWPSTALGCPRPGFSYAQVVTSGYEVHLEAGGESYEYHTNLSTNIVLCSTTAS